ncbi:MAG: lipoprotein insertase outer membrane protein LolB [Gammaproteobacteria bacterium]
MRRILAVPALLVALQLAGCAVRPVQPGTVIDWDERAAALSVGSPWRARGRLAFKSGKDGGQASLTWVQADGGTHISLRGPFGVGSYEIAWDSERIAVNGTNGARAEIYTGRDAADRFLERQLGWSFPARSVRFWMLGIADPEYPSRRSVDASGWLAGIDQNGWAVSYSRFDKVGDHYLPGKIVMENERARVRLLVDEWTWGSASDR